MLATSPTPSKSALIGKVIGGKYELLELLNETGESVAFRTALPSGSAAELMMFAAGDATQVRETLQRWARAKQLSHPNLLRVFDYGEEAFGEIRFPYTVSELTDDNLARVLAQRALTHEEMSVLLDPLLEGLAFLHARKLAQGSLAPENVAALGDTVKLRMDALQEDGDGKRAMEDVRALGRLIIESLTQRVAGDGRMQAEILREPFRTVARHCLAHDANERWSVRKMQEFLHPAPATSATDELTAELRAEKPFRITRAQMIAGAAVLFVVAVLFAIISMQRRGAGATQQSAVADVAAPVVPGRAAKQETAVVPAKPLTAQVKEVVPQPSAKAQRSIHGTIKVRVAVTAGQDGRVESAKVVRSGSSQYFRRLAEQAAGQWVFPGAGQHRIEFRFKRAGNTAQLVG
ncbi:MAG: hypothetical protein NVS9B15_10810 [Acidobacteriaceae bacterium]